MIVASHEGMFGDRDFIYLTVVPPGAAVTPISSGSSALGAGGRELARCRSRRRCSPRLFTLLLLRSFRRRPAGQKLLWAGGFALFAVATASEAVAQGSGWSAGLFRSYYLCGGVLTVGLARRGLRVAAAPPR